LTSRRCGFVAPVLWTFFLLCGLAAASPAPAASGLPHRAYLGMAFTALSDARADSLHLVSGGLLLDRVLPGGPAERSGLRAGDIIENLDGQPVPTESALRALLRRHHAGDAIRAAILHGGEHRTVRVVAGGSPEETSDSLDIGYTSFTTGGVRLRAVLASPRGSAGKRLPAVLMVSALGSPQLMATPGYSATRQTAFDLASAGFRVLRFDLRGFGDSEGEDFRTTDFETEVGDNVAAFDYLASRPDVDPKHVFVYGHSTGGMEAAVLAGRRRPGGLIVSCTIGRTMLERMLETVRLQNRLGGQSETTADRDANTYVQFSAAIMRGATAEELRRDSTFAQFFNAAGRIMDDRTVEFWRQQLNLPLAAVYERVKCPTLVVWAASDFLTQFACHERIRDVLVGAGNPDVTLRVIPAADHTYSPARDFQDAWENYHGRGFRKNPDAMVPLMEWLWRH
jgi:pimeloyl-ACP methyl ester carboxylesterase